MTNLDSFTRAYIEAALWSSTTDDDTPMDRDYSVSDISVSTLAKMVADCAAFPNCKRRTAFKRVPHTRRLR